ncbi:MAG: SRPBCC family protein [Nereida ignava]|uniref:SRPBCC family protein n=1 Tax=Halocynthiibacter sp. TaxID=1979210 RepID=UPI003C537708
MTRSSLLNSTHLVATLLATTFSAPLLADTSNNMACDGSLMHGSITQISATHATIETSILIDAAPAEVWATLTNFEAMPDWSTGTLQGITGNVENGGSVVVTFLFGVDDAGNPVSNEIPHTLIFKGGEKIGWSDPFPADLGGGHDNHIYAVRPCGDKTQFTQSDEIVDNPYAVNFVTQLLPGYQLFNAELKAAVEN